MGYNDWVNSITGQKANTKTAVTTGGGYSQWLESLREESEKKVSSALLEKVGDTNGDNSIDVRDLVRKKKIEQQEAMKTVDIGALQTEIDTLQSILNTANSKRPKTNVLTKNDVTFDMAIYKRKKEEEEFNTYLKSVGYSNIEDIEKTLTEKKAYKNKAQIIQDRILLSSVADPESANYDKEFEKYAEKGETLSKERNAWYQSGYKNQIGYLRSNSDLIKTYEDTGDENGAIVSSVLSNQLTYLAAKYMTDEEFSIYNYHLAKETDGLADKGTAEKYLKSIQDTLTDRQGKTIADEKESSLSKYTYGYKAGTDQFVQNLINRFNTKDNYIPVTGIQKASAQIRTDIKEQDGIIGQIGYDIINTSSNMLPSILTSTAVGVINPTVGAVTGATLMGASASGGAYQEMLNLGYDKKQANAYSILVGASEAALSYAFSGISKLGGKATNHIVKTAISKIDNGLAKFAIEFGIKVGSEGLEEAAQEVLTPLFENVALGYEKNTLEDIDWSQVAYSGLLGMLSSVGFSGIETANDIKDSKPSIISNEENNSNKRLTANDLERYMGVGKTQHTRNKKTRMLESGKNPILTSSLEIKEFILNSISGKALGEVRAYGIVGNRLAQAIKEKRNSLDLEGKYLELNADDLRESYKRHLTPKDKGDIALTEDDFVGIPEYIDNFDYVLGVNEYNGKIEIHLAKETDDGYIKILTVSSKERESLQATKIIGISKEKFNEKYAKKIERDTGSLRGLTDISENSNPSTTAQHTAGTLSKNSVPQKAQSVNNIISTDGAENSTNEHRGLSNPKTQEIYRDPTTEDSFARRDAKQRHISDIAKKLDKDLKIVWVEHNSEILKGKNGKFVRSMNTMYLAKDVSVVEMYIEVFKHEFVHRLESRKAYVSFKEYLIKFSGAFEQYARAQLRMAAEVSTKLYENKRLNFESKEALEQYRNRLVEIAENGTREEVISAISEHYHKTFVDDRGINKPARDKFTMEDAQREMVADFVAEVLFKGKNNRLNIAQALSEEDILAIGKIEGSADTFLNELTTDNRNLLQKIIDVIKDFIANLKGLKQNERLVTDLEYIEQRLSRVYNSKDTKKAAEKSAGEQFSSDINLKITQSMSDDNRAKILKNKKITNIKSIKELPNDILQKFSEISSWDDINNLFGKNKSNIIKKIASEFGVFKKYSNSDINVEFEFSNNNFRESYHKQKTNYEQFAKMFSVFDDVINSAVGIEVHKREKYKPDPTLENVYVLMSAFEDGELIIPVKLEIKEFKDKQNTLYVAISLEGIKKAEVSKQGTTENGVAQNSRSATISICDLISKINPKDANFLKYIPNQLLNNEQIEAKNKIDESFSVGSPMQQARENLARYENGEISREEYLEENDRLWGAANEKYGAIEQGENADAPISTPKAVADDKPTERFIRTVIETGKLTEEMVENVETEILLGDFSYTAISDETATKKAEATIRNGTAEAVWTEAVFEGKQLSKNQIAVGEQLLANAIKSGDTLKVLEISSQLADIFTRAGQVVQAASLLKKMTGAGRLVSAQRTVDTLNKSMRQKYGEDRKPIKISPESAKRLANAKTEKGIEHAYQEIMQEVADQVPVTFLDKWNSWRYFAMLSNPKTHIRNLLGNGIFVPVVRIKDFIATGIEAGASAMGILDSSDRTKSLVIKQEYAEFAKKDSQNDWVRQLLKGNKYNDKNALKEKQRIFKNDALEFLTQFNSNALEAEDMLFKNKHYIHALAGFLQARNVNLKTVSEDVLTEARIYAVNEARKATFNDESALANWVQNLGNKNLAANIAVEGTLPFKRTPINVVKRGVEYSPIGLGKTLTKGIFDVKKGKITPTEFIDGLASGITGTGIMLVGMFLANLGCISGGKDDDEESNFEKWLGKQEYSVEILGKSYTIDWAAPACIPFFIGVEIINTMNTGEDFQFSQIGNAVWNSLEPITNLSMLSGIQGVIESARYADSSQTLAAIAGDAITSYAMQGIPSLAGAVSRTIDPTQRSWYTDKNSTLFDSFAQSVGNNIRSKVPGLSLTQIPKIDPWGREVSRGNVGERVLENFVSPGYYSKIEYSETSEELKRIFVQTGESVFPKTAAKSFEVNGETKQLTADEYVTYAKAKGEYSFDYIQEFINSTPYNKLTDDERAEVITNLYKFANAKAKSTVSDYDPAEINTFKTVTRWERNGRSAVNYYIANAVDK